MSLNQKTMLLINGSLSLLALVFLILLVMTFLRAPADPERVLRPSSTPVTSLSWSWFTSVDSPVIGSSAAPVQAAEEEYDEVRVDAELLGVIISPTFASATIKLGRNPEKVYHIGDEISSGLEVTNIEALRVVVSQRGNKMQLSFPKPNELETEVVSTSQAVSSLIGQSKIELANVFSAVPVAVAGYPGGFKVGDLSEDLKVLAGIQNDDVVVQVGDSNVQEIMANPAQWIKYGLETALPVTVMRNGQETIIYVNALDLSSKLMPTLGQ